MVLKQFFLDKCPFHFIFLFFHGYPPIDIMICKSRSTCSKSFIFPVNQMLFLPELAKKLPVDPLFVRF